jgi:hypothetical protein
MTATSLLYDGDIVQINRPEYPPYSKFRRGTIEWLEGESIGVRLDANDTLEQFLIDDCTLIARGEKYHYETKIDAQAERLRKLEAALREIATHGDSRNPGVQASTWWTSNAYSEVKEIAVSALSDWTPFDDIVAGVDEDTAHGG